MKLKLLHSIYLELCNAVKLPFLLPLIFFIGHNSGFSQPYYIAAGHWLLSYDPGDNLCSMCDHNFHGTMGPVSAWGGCSFGPDGNFFIMSHDNGPPYDNANDIYQIDLNTLIPTLIFDGPNDMVLMTGIVAVGNGIFYTIPRISSNNDTLYRWDTNSGIIEAVGSTGYPPWSEMWMAEGYLYYISATNGNNPRQLIRVDPLNPSDSEVMCGFLWAYGIFGMTATPISGLFIGTEIWLNNVMLVTLNVHDCSITEICDISDIGVTGGVHDQSSPYEHDLDPVTSVYIDLDCNDSSGATEADYNGDPFDCLNEEGIGINDIDVRIYIDAPIAEMRIELTDPVDTPDEELIMAGTIPGISVSGSGSTMITLTNSGGAKASDFNNALDLIRYTNSSLYPTAGVRTVEVQFTTAVGTESNTASAFIEVIELPHIPVDLGPDIEICDGEIATLDASDTGEEYIWSNGATTPTINVNNPGIYSVTVSDGINCPDKDEIEVTVLPIITLSLTGDTAICENSTATLTINTDTPYPLTIEIDASPGFPFVFNDVTGNFDFNDVPFTTTEYTISDVTSSQAACFNIVDNYQVVEIYPHYHDSAEILLCGGDSVLLGNTWISDPGIYPVLFNSIYGCDSSVYFSVNTLPAETIFYMDSTCLLSEVGVFITYLNNPDGCDTVVQTTVSLLQSDTIIINLFSCNSDNTGMFITSFVNQDGCDSSVITKINLIPPDDTTSIFILTCDTSTLGVFQETVTNQSGCDSLIITTINLAPADTNYLYGVSCDPSSIGIHQNLFSNHSGCDSLVITTINAGSSDTMYLFATSCDSSTLGIVEEHFITPAGCDSTVFTTITYSANDSTFVHSASCDPADIGVFIDLYINRFGCDSIVTRNVALLPTSEIFLNAESCDPTEAGTFVQILTNRFGCDSIVTTAVELLPTDHTSLFSTTCNENSVGTFITVHQNQFGCDSIVTRTVSLIVPDTTLLVSRTCFENETGIVEYILTNQYGCDSLVIETIELFNLPEVYIEITSDFNGYAISCFAANDGRVEAITTGVSPWGYLWSTGSSDQSITGLEAGLFELTVTDGNACTTAADVMIEEPPLMSINLSVNEPDCFDQQEGIITILPSGGVGPFQYSIDGINFTSSNIFTGLAEGTYQLTTLDANDCEVKEIIWINVPLQVSVDLGADRTLIFGDTFLIEAIVNVPYDSLSIIDWSGIDSVACPECLIQPLAPIITTSYSVSVTTIDGCHDEDGITIKVEVHDDIYVPNIFSPNGDQINDFFIINAGSSIELISYLLIYDRWGNAVFSANNFQPGDVHSAWDGKLNGKQMNPGVFAYRLITQLKDGRQVIRYGDVTLIR